jgi:hypothetical protein
MVVAPSLEPQALDVAALVPCETCGGTGWTTPKTGERTVDSPSTASSRTSSARRRA